MGILSYREDMSTSSAIVMGHAEALDRADVMEVAGRMSRGFRVYHVIGCVFWMLDDAAKHQLVGEPQEQDPNERVFRHASAERMHRACIEWHDRLSGGTFPTDPGGSLHNWRWHAGPFDTADVLSMTRLRAMLRHAHAAVGDLRILGELADFAERVIALAEQPDATWAHTLRKRLAVVRAIADLPEAPATEEEGAYWKRYAAEGRTSP